MSEMYRRIRALGEGEKLEEGGKIRLLASTDDPVNWGGWREILSHKEGAIDMSAARSLLVNHDPDQLCGGISGMTSDGRTLSSDAEIDEDARMRSGVSVRKMVSKKRLNGVSIGYTYDRADTTVDEETRTVTVNRWRLLEISLTPIPADARAQVRSFPFPDSDPVKPAAPAASQERSAMPDNQNAAGNNAANGDEASRAREIELLRERAVKAEREAKLRALAGEYQVDTKDLDFASFRDEAEGTRALMKRLADKNATPEPKAAAVSVTRDARDKADDAFTGALAFAAGFRGNENKHKDNNPLLGESLTSICAAWARQVGVRTGDWSKRDLAWFILGQPDQMRNNRDAANVTSSNFTGFTMLNAMTKIAAMGYVRDESNNVWPLISSSQIVPDFKAYYIGGLGMGNLSQTAEDVAFPELDKVDGTYNGTAKMWGGTVSLTLQALVNDDTGQFMRNLGQAGGLLNKTKDKRCIQKLLMGTSSSTGTSTWTSNTTSGGTLVYTTQDLMAAARAKLGLVRTALINKIGLDGNPLGTIAKFLLVPPTREMEAQGLVGNSGPGLQAGAPQSAISSLTVLSSAWLEASALTGNSTTSYYLIGDPNRVTGLVQSEVAGMQGPQVEQYDSGAVAARKWKIYSPFEFDLFYAANGSGTNIIPAIQQGTT